MKNTLPFALASTLLLEACATPPAGPLATARSEIKGCQSEEKAAACPKSSVVNINLRKAGGSGANPECVTAKRGSSITVNITPASGKVGGIVTLPEEATNGWLVASNVDASMKHKIVIDIPEDAVEGEHKYFVLSDAGACLDPRIHIN